MRLVLRFGLAQRSINYWPKASKMGVLAEIYLGLINLRLKSLDLEYTISGGYANNPKMGASELLVRSSLSKLGFQYHRTPLANYKTVRLVVPKPFVFGTIV
jgi:hypothetical protein